MQLFDLIQRLNQSHGPAGDEGEICQVIADVARPYADEITVDTLGNLIVHKKGSGPKVMLAAHMDSIGFIVTHIEETGFLRVGRLGGIDAKEAIYANVRFRNGIKGIFVPEEKADFSKLTIDECYIDIGASNRENALSMVQVGDTAVYDTACFCNRSKVFSPYLDNRISCAVLLCALAQMKGCNNDLYLVFTVQEEVGLRGGKTAAWAIDPDYGVAVDVTDVDDTPGTQRSGTAQLGKGAAIKVMDSSIICHPAMVDKLVTLAKAIEIPIQRDILRAGGTDAGAIHTTRLGVQTGGISIPCRYVHGPIEVADLADVEACVKLVYAFAQSQLERL